MKIKYTVRIKPEHEPPDIGGGKGVISTQEVIYKNTELGDIFISFEIQNHKKELIEEWVEVTHEIIK